MAYFLLAGRPPFVNSNPIMLIVAHATADIPSLAEVGADVPADLANVVMKCLNRDPDDRFRSFRDVLNAIEACEQFGTWDRSDAEQWWAEHANDDSQTGQQAEAGTLPFKAETEVTLEDIRLPGLAFESNGIDFDEPTLIG